MINKKKKVITKRGWYKPAGNKFNLALDKFEAWLEMVHQSFLLSISPNLRSQIRCKKGCPHCCKGQTVLTNIMEGVLIARHLVSFSNNQELATWNAKLKEVSEKQLKLSFQEWWDSKTPCPFFSDGICSIYRVRPGTCRFFYVVSNPEFCATEPFEGQQIVGIKRDKAYEQLERLCLDTTEKLLGKRELITFILPVAVLSGLNILGKLNEKSQQDL